MKFGKLIEYNLRDIFLKKLYENVVEKLFPDPFLKNQNWACVWINILKFYVFCFYCLPRWGLSEVIETQLQITCIYLKWSFFKKQKEDWN